MKMYLKLVLIFLSTVLFLPSAGIANDIGPLTFLTENYAPFNYEKNGRLKGISIELLLKMFRQVNSSKTAEDIKVLPWARAYKMAQTEKNTVLFSTTRTKSREKLFKWVGPIAPTVVSIIAKKGENFKIDSVADINALRVATVKDDIGELLLTNMGISINDLVRTSSSKAAARVLAAGRVDLWSYEQSVAKWNLNEVGQNPDDYKIVKILEKSHLYFAIQKDTDDKLVKSLQDALDKVRAIKIKSGN